MALHEVSMLILYNTAYRAVIVRYRNTASFSRHYRNTAQNLPPIPQYRKPRSTLHKEKCFTAVRSGYWGFKACCSAYWYGQPWRIRNTTEYFDLSKITDAISTFFEIFIKSRRIPRSFQYPTEIIVPTLLLHRSDRIILRGTSIKIRKQALRDQKYDLKQMLPDVRRIFSKFQMK